MKNARFDTRHGNRNRVQLWTSREKLTGQTIKLYLKGIWYRFTTSYWFLPTFILMMAVLLSFLTLIIDDRYGSSWITQWRWIYSHDPAGARAVLSTVAGSMITVAGVVFSITIVVLTLASNQFGPRLIRNFMIDRRTQLVLGVFTATYLYCLLILRRTQAIEDTTFVPTFSLATAILLAILSIAVLIYYIHHVATFMQVENVVNSVSRELHAILERLFPSEEEACADDRETLKLAAPSCPIPISRSGYIQAVDHEGLVRLACRHEGQLELLYRPGFYLVAGATVARFSPSEKADDELISGINAALLLGSHPTPAQDPEFAVRQLAEVAVRALSSGINDPFTAMTCIDRIATGLAMAASRAPQPTTYRDEDGQIRLIDHPITFADLAEAAYNPLRRYGGEQITVVLKLLESLAMILPLTHREQNRQVLYEHGALIYERCLARIEQDQDRRELDKGYQALKQLMTDPSLEQDRPAPGATVENTP